MNSKKRNSLFIVSFLLVLLAVSFYFYTRNPFETASQCPGTFTDFAYSPEPRKLATTLPQHPWEMEAQLPETPTLRITFSVEAVRLINGYTEIWIKRHPFDDYYSGTYASDYQFWVYRTDTKEWRNLPAKVENSDASIAKLYVTKDGTLWGSNVWGASHHFVNEPVISKYNEASGRFEYVSVTKGIPTGWVYPDPRIGGSTYWSDILLDANDVFWIVPRKDAVYSYNPATNQVKKYANIDVNTEQAVLAPDGSIFISVDLTDPFLGPYYYSLQKGEILRFDAKTNQLETVKIPFESWPTYNELFTDSSGRLWLGAVGWRNPDGSWRRLYPNPLLYFWKVGDGSHWRVIDPTPMLESSDGRIWFHKSVDDSKEWGMAWLDPQTMMGCWFTTVVTNIVEDQQRNLWMVADGVLYKYQLEQ
jgi:ligand-binding sensor domain-containing protein